MLHPPLALATGAWAALFVGAFIWAVYEFARAHVPPMRVLRLFRRLAVLSTTVRMGGMCTRAELRSSLSEQARTLPPLAAL